MCNCWEKLEEVYTVVNCNKSTLKSDISTAEEKLLCKFNDELIELLSYSNGLTGEYDLPILYSLDEIVKCNINFRTDSILIDTYKSFDNMLFFLDAGNGDYFGFEVDNNECKDEVVVWNHENDTRRYLSENLFVFLYGWGNGDISI